MYLLARLVRFAATIVVAFILAGIAIHLLDANLSNGIVSAVNDVAKWLAHPFRNVFDLAALVYAAVAAVIVAVLARASLGAGRFRRRSVT